MNATHVLFNISPPRKTHKVTNKLSKLIFDNDDLTFDACSKIFSNSLQAKEKRRKSRIKKCAYIAFFKRNKVFMHQMV